MTHVSVGEPRTDQPSEYDVAIVGYGPCGQAAAAVLGAYGHRVVVFERHPTLYSLPRAGHVDHEIVRILQSLERAESFIAATAVPIRKYFWFNGQGQDLMTMDWDKKEVSGWESDYMMWQPYLEDALDSSVREQAHTEVNQGWEAVELTQDEDGVTLTVLEMRREADGSRVAGDRRRTIRARYLIGADGANGFVRDAVGIERDDYGFNERWLDVDTKPKRRLSEGAGRIGEREVTFGLDVFQICDPARPRYLAPLGKEHRRFEWSLLDGESTEEFESPAKAYELLTEWGVTPEDLEIVRQAVYTFEAKVAREFRRGHVFLVGDSAHSMPPHMGQGACTGIRDAKTLAWKLDLVLRDVAPERLLDSYETERKSNARGWVELSLAVGKISATLDPQAAAERDAAFFRGEPPFIPPLPTLTGGVLHRDPSGAVAPPAGLLSPQGEVELDGRRGLLDDFAPQRGGFSIVSIAGDPRAVLSERQLDLLAALRTTYAAVYLDRRLPAPGEALDLEGIYADWFGAHGAAAILVRPDFYVFGAAPSIDDLPDLVDELDQMLGES
ncbi:MAG TPA: bifunctional 3-(3-hydroxy-phenyl)propionate/3-hydroxycinnamic acid hydroxylase [Solirubrobacterales bacterium]|nr:bifunctional 3-(3-hydroxy-phenyl)propionate/3-hydroxycinnamic acid hydroxylase [Solirubrobacterales bacterium]